MENVFIIHLSLNCATYRFACNTNFDVVPASAINPANARIRPWAGDLYLIEDDLI